MRTSEAYGHSYCSNITSHMNELSKLQRTWAKRINDLKVLPDVVFLELRLCNRDQDNLAQQLRHCKALGRKSKTM